jgi:hypothetical protein
MKTHRVALLLAVVSTQGAAACLDFTPITSFGATPDAAAASPLDASSDTGARSQANKCLTCAAGTGDGGGCPQEFAACEAFEACKTAATCATGECLTSFANITQCLAGCEADAGVSDPSSPANPPFSALLSCMSTHCQTACLP